MKKYLSTFQGRVTLVILVLILTMITVSLFMASAKETLGIVYPDRLITSSDALKEKLRPYNEEQQVLVDKLSDSNLNPDEMDEIMLEIEDLTEKMEEIIANRPVVEDRQFIEALIDEINDQKPRISVSLDIVKKNNGSYISIQMEGPGNVGMEECNYGYDSRNILLCEDGSAYLMMMNPERTDWFISEVHISRQLYKELEILISEESS